jgi:hypothetical protein
MKEGRENKDQNNEKYFKNSELPKQYQNNAQRVNEGKKKRKFEPPKLEKEISELPENSNRQIK